MRKLAVVAAAALILAGGIESANAQYWRGPGWGYYGGYYRHGWGWGGGALAAGLIGGAILGGLITAAAAPYGYGYYGPWPGYYYPHPVYYGPPVYARPLYRWRRPYGIHRAFYGPGFVRPYVVYR